MDTTSTKSAEPMTAERLAEIEARVPAGAHPWRIEPRIVGYEGGQEEREEGFEIWTATPDGEWVVAEVHGEWATDEETGGDEGTRVVQIDATHDVHPDAASIAQFLLHSQRDVPDLLAENARLRAELAKYVGWEPTVKQEYDHAVAQSEACMQAVRDFKRDHERYITEPGRDEAVTALVVALEQALEVW